MFLEYVHMGMAHIGASVSEWFGPAGFHFPDGIDHILFLVALALGGGSLLNTLKSATGFAVGHSITLALAALGFVNPPTRYVESAIALSIAFLAAESLIRKDSEARWKVAAAFGLVHGLGFAAALQNLHLEKTQALFALFGFNLGVEFGQILILSVLVPIILEMRRYPLLKSYGLKPCALGVCGIGAYWFAIRVFN